jgi:hypothetical protein
MVEQAGALAKPILQPLLDSISSKLDNLTQVSATGTVTLTKPTGTDKSQTTCPCVIGTRNSQELWMTFSGHGVLPDINVVLSPPCSCTPSDIVEMVGG